MTKTPAKPQPDRNLSRKASRNRANSAPRCCATAARGDARRTGHGTASPQSRVRRFEAQIRADGKQPRGHPDQGCPARSTGTRGGLMGAIAIPTREQSPLPAGPRAKVRLGHPHARAGMASTPSLSLRLSRPAERCGFTPLLPHMGILAALQPPRRTRMNSLAKQRGWPTAPHPAAPRTQAPLRGPAPP